MSSKQRKSFISRVFPHAFSDFGWYAVQNFAHGELAIGALIEESRANTKSGIVNPI
jgi:hypothetical protein